MSVDTLARSLAAGYSDKARSAEEIALEAKQAAETAVETAVEAVPAAVTTWLDANVDPVGSAVAVDSSLTISGAAADAKVTGEGIADLKNAIDETDEVLKFDTVVAIPFSIAASGSINASNGDTISSSAYEHTDYIDVSKYKNITYKRVTSTTTSTAISFGIALYDANKQYVNGKKAAGSTTAGYEIDTIRIGRNIKYIRATTRVDIETYGQFEISGTPRLSDIVEDGRNLWAYGDVEVNRPSGTEHIFLDEFLPAGIYTLECDVIGNANTAVMVYFLSSTLTSIAASNAVAALTLSSQHHNKITFTLSGTAKGIGFCAGVGTTASAGKKAYYRNIVLLAGDSYDASATYVSPNNDALNAFAEITDLSQQFVMGGYIATSGATADLNGVVSRDTWAYQIIPCEKDEEFVTVTLGQETPRAWAFIDSEGNILAKAYAISGINHNTPLTPERLKAPTGAKHLILNHYLLSNLGWTPKAYKLSGNPVVDKAAFDNHVLPPIEYSVWKRKIVAAYDKYLVMLDGTALRRSADCGKTWNTGVNVSDVGVIKGYHMFATGTLAFFTHTKAYYISDWTNYSEATCYEADGTTEYQPNGSNNFDALNDLKERKFIGSQDMYVFGNYTTDNNTRKLIWYSIDDGKTYKIAYEFNLSETYPARHVHTVIYYKPADTFIVTTGDNNATECRVFGFQYNVENDSWTNAVLGGSSRDYKWAGVAIWGDNIYYTYDNTPGKVLTCKYNNIGDLTKHETVIGTSTSDITGIIIGPRGDMIVGCSHARSTGGVTHVFPLSADVDCRKIYYSSNRKDFAEIILDPQILDSYSARARALPVTAEGHYICGFHGDGDAGTTNWDHLPSAFVDEYVRLAGFKDAFKPL